MPPVPKEKVPGRFSHGFSQNKHKQDAPDSFQAAHAKKRDVPASSCCGEDWDHVEENGLGTMNAEKDLVHIPAQCHVSAKTGLSAIHDLTWTRI